MPSHLVVKIGSDRFNEQPVIINRSDRPFEIDSEHFVGRVLVRVRDAPGAKEGQDGMEYFKDRSRKFCIQIEGRFKKQWKGSQILFGTDFDHLVDIPRAPFNTGMRIARFIDPCTFYEETPPSGRPYIMSPYVACMNTICAWPAPSRAQDAVVVLRQVKDGAGKSPGITRSTTPILNENKGKSKDSSLTSSPINSEDEGDVVPVESLHRTSSVKKEDGTNSNGNVPTTTTDKKKKRSSWFGGFGGPVKEKDERKPKKYWRFVGFKDEPAVRAILEAHHADSRIERSSSIARSRRQGSGSESGSIPSTSTSPSPMNDQNRRNLSPSDVQHGPTPPTLSRLGTSNLGEVLAPPERSNTPRPPDGFDSSSRASSPISPLVGNLTSPITNTFSGIAQSIASPIANIVRSPSPLAKEVINEESSSSSSTTTNQKNGSITSHHQKSPSTTIPPHPLEQKNGSNSNSSSTSPQIKATITPAPRLVAPKAQMAQVQPDTEELEPEPEFPPLERISSDVRHKAQEAAKSDGLEEKDFKLADELMNHLHLNHSSSNDKEWKSKLDEQLGPYRFSDPSTDMMEDNAFIFKWDSVPVPKRRKHFADAQVREDFIYDPDIVYGTSFFTDAADLNTLSLSLGPVKMGLQRFFTDMPIRYSLRATGPEELTFCTVSFQLVED